MASQDFTGKTIIITGGSSGIGKATATECVRRGACVIVVAEVADRVKMAVDEISKAAKKGGSVTGYSVDIADLKAVKVVFDQIFLKFPTIDVLINNAGYATYHTFAEMSVEEIDRHTRVNYLGHLYASKFVLDRMLPIRKGHVITVGSVAGRMAITPNGVYSAAKHGLVAMTDLLRCEYEPFGIHISLFLPGRVDTPFFDHETFRKRTTPRESSHAMSTSYAAGLMLKMIEKKPREVIAPRFYRIVIWALPAFGLFLKPVYWRLIKRRVIAHYKDTQMPSTLPIG